MNIKKYLSGLLAGALLTVGIGGADVEAASKNAMRTVITNDGEVDDMNSVIRALLYSNEMDGGWVGVSARSTKTIARSTMPWITIR